MRSGTVHHKSDRKSCVLPTADRNNGGVALKIIQVIALKRCDRQTDGQTDGMTDAV